MIHIFLYEIKNRRKSFLFSIFGALWLLLSWGIMKLFPKAIVTTAQLCNKYNWLRIFLGITETIESVTYETIISAALIPFVILAFYKTMSGTANTIRQEEHLGTLLYFQTIPVSKTCFLLVKLLVSLLLLILESIIWGILIWRLSLYNSPEHEFFYAVITEHTIHRITAFCCANFLALGIGFLYGCISHKPTAGYFTTNLLFLGIQLAILPNLLQCCTMILQENGYSVTAFAPYIDNITSIRSFNPIYWSNPAVSIVFLITENVIAPCMAIGLILIIIGFITHARWGKAEN